MPSVSKAQQKLMGMAYATRKGKLKNPSPRIKKIAGSMRLKDLKDFAETNTKGLPDKIGEDFGLATIDTTIGVGSINPPGPDFKQTGSGDNFGLGKKQNDQPDKKKQKKNKNTLRYIKGFSEYKKMK